MKIYSMTATFGALEHQTLTLKPGLNIIEAPNEWGKSTWCAFLVNMLYGLDTRARSTKDNLADKDRYAPWSGLPMSGRIDLNWNGKDITIERRTKGRLVFGEFSAYETATGLEVPELNGSNCGQLLLGVERSVFTRSGFLKLTDLPVTQDEALRRRLNALVTTGDESGAGDKLQQALKDLKNKCRYNKTGLLPQAENQREQLEGQLHELSLLDQQCAQLGSRQVELKKLIADLENHKNALRYEAAQTDAEKVSKAIAAREEAQAVYAGLEKNCEGLPCLAEAQEALQEGKSLQQQLLALQTESALLPPLPEKPAIPAHLASIPPCEALVAAQADLQALTALERRKKRKNIILSVLYALAVLILAAGIIAKFLFFVNVSFLLPVLTGSAVVIMLGCIVGTLLFTARWRDQVEALYEKHPGIPANRWLTDAQEYAQAHKSYEEALVNAKAKRGDLDQRQTTLSAKIAEFSKGSDLTECLDQWQQIVAARDALADAARELKHAENYTATLQSMAKTAEPPEFPDTLTCTDSETDAFLNSARFELHQLQQKLGQAQGRCEALGQESVLRAQLKAVNSRIQRLEDTYHALELAQTALSSATSELQRRFAPRISKRAQAIFQQLTQGRYQRFTLSEDLSVNVCAENEDTLRGAEWRSDGTEDQLYLALRLAVAEELTPDAPLILDDAFVRFDDKRLKVALEILQELSSSKQVILFTCQGRENALQGGTP